jgi:hypothetical protein
MMLDIRPRCVHHLARLMVSVELYDDLDGELTSFPAFACQERGCGELYSAVHGYFRWSAARMVPDRSQRPCPRDGSPMFLAEAGGGTRTHRCSECGGQESTSSIAAAT